MIVGNFKGKFCGSSTTKNTQYILTKWMFPQSEFGKVFTLEEMPQPKMTTILHDLRAYPKIMEVKEGQTCELQCGVSLKKGNTKDGKTYPPQVQLNIVNHKVIG